MKEKLLNMKVLLTIIVLLSTLGITLNAQQPPKVAIITADYYGGPGEQQLAVDLLATGRVELVDFWNATPVVEDGNPPGVQPTLEEIMEYDVIVLSSNSSLIDPVALGNDLDVFAQTGGGVILTPYAFDNTSSFLTWLQGSWENGQWDIVQNHEMNFLFDDCYTGISEVYEPESPLVQGLETLSFSRYGACFITNPPLVEGAVRVVDMEAGGGLPLIYRHDLLPNRIDLGCRPVVAEDCGDSGLMAGGANFIANCIEYVSDMAIGISNNPAGVGLPELNQNWPNPFKGSTIISYSIPEGQNEKISIKVFNMHGQEIITLVDAEQSGSHEVVFDATGLPGGMYYCALSTNDSIQIRKLIIEK